MVELSEQELQDLYTWIDEIPLSRPKKNISRDFSDAVMAAELVSYYFPRLVELHNYSTANSFGQKLENWRLINRKVFAKLDLSVPDELLQSVAASKPGVIEYLLDHLKSKIELFQKCTSEDMFGNFPDSTEHYQFNTTAGNTVTNQIQDTRHAMMSPSQQSIPKQSSRNLPPLVKSPIGPSSMHSIKQHPSKHPKPSHIPRPTNSSNSINSKHTLPPINHEVLGQINGGVIWEPSANTQTNLPIIKDGTKSNRGIAPKTSKRDINYANQHHLGVASHWFRRTSNTKEMNNGFSKDGMLVMAEKDQMIMELQETVQLLQMKVKRLEHLIKIKDYKLQDIEKHASNTGSKTGPTMR